MIPSDDTIAVVILNYNGRQYLEQFLAQVLDHTPAPHRVVVADNASTDDSVAWIRQHFPQVEIICLNRNYGFCAGYNRALAQVEADYYVLLNSDVEVSEGWLEPLLSRLQQHPNWAAIQPKIRAYHQRDAFEYAGAGGGLIDCWGYPLCRGRIFDALEVDEGQYDDDCFIFWASGACMMVRAQVWHALGGLADDFFAHMEEIDFCWRAQRAGYGIAYTAQSVVYHVGGGTLAAHNPFKTFLNFRNNLALLARNLPRPAYYRVMVVRLLLDTLALLRWALAGDWGQVQAIVKAYRAFYGSWGKTFRRSYVRPYPLSRLAGRLPYSLVWQRFVRGRVKFRELPKIYTK